MAESQRVDYEGADRGDVSDGYHTFNELYEHRHWLFVSMLKAHREFAWAAPKHADGSMYDGWFVAGIKLPAGDITYHLPMRLWGVVKSFGIAQHTAPPWDGHTSDDVIERLQDWCNS